MTEHINGDGPQNLKNAFAVMRGEVRRIKRLARRGRIHLPPGVSLKRLPRSLCSLCSRVWDFAMVPEDTLPRHGICSGCKAELANGFTALIHPSKTPIWMKSKPLKDCGLDGKIVNVTAEEYDVFWRKANPNVPNSGPDKAD